MFIVFVLSDYYVYLQGSVTVCCVCVVMCVNVRVQMCICMVYVDVILVLCVHACGLLHVSVHINTYVACLCVMCYVCTCMSVYVCVVLGLCACRSCTNV